MSLQVPLLKTKVGQPKPLGPICIEHHFIAGADSEQTKTGIGCWNFAVYAPEAKALTLCLFQPDTEEPIAELSFIGRTADIWHLEVSGIADNTLYALSVDGVNQPQQGFCFDAERLLIDPYCRQLNRPQNYQPRLYESKSALFISKGVLKHHSFDWQQIGKPEIPAEQTIIYEAHVKGMTMLHPEVPEELRGTYLGLCHPAIIQHLQQLGITSIQLLPVASFMSEPRLESMQLSNYWGYNPVNFFAPDARYQLHDAVTEFKTMVRTFHQHGIEVILDVVFNHTAEAGADGPLLSFRGLANRQYYLFHNHADITDFQNYCNFTGCGNTLNVAHPLMQKMVMDALRYWLTEMQVDGFRFDLAVTLGREHKRFNPYAAFFQIIAQDPVISQAKLIAEPWDVGPFGYHLGQFPANWAELNDKCRDTFRAFWRGNKGTLAEFTTRLLGSRDIFQQHRMPANCSVNYLCYHDGYTLHDLVSYEQKHNWLNGEQNQDGHSHNLSLNHGVEGPSRDPLIIKQRFLHKRNLVATLLFSQGMIHWLGGDELSHTQRGNNNAYCQDNAVSWLHWQLDKDSKDFLQFVQQMMELRKRFPCLQQLSLLDEQYQLHGDKHRVQWYLASGDLKQSHDWHDPDRSCCMFSITNTSSNSSLLFVFNAADHELSLELPDEHWQLLLDTQLEQGKLQADGPVCQQYLQAPFSISLWQNM
ncbi:glycogen debranching protein GlgX [Alkalimonas collagenimarina]|uniref:Glycogen debranching protein GlgX n=1 Tax=Alkalimonas collagenimarina TaxID=400390 RepID=A0ABT9H291_9GAMM|nr:glycogen debranching protein GlgX [Alkalimonas collagenimarina]MDP4537412.1 glycogen debranching protein GlgX [Alkalimonas collagenimarina]